MRQARERLAFLRGTLAAQEARRAFTQSAERTSSRDRTATRAPGTRTPTPLPERSAPPPVRSEQLRSAAPDRTVDEKLRIIEERRERARELLARAWEHQAREASRGRGIE